jgi:peptidoglycan L-alanyl-D-glutamate endopeptidase CwlK
VQKNKILITGALIALIFLIKPKKKKKLMPENIINTLHPSIREKVKLFQLKAKQQLIPFRITSGGRSYLEQAEIYAQGRTKPGKIVSFAPPGSSYHNFGLAFDIIPLNSLGKGDYNSPNWEKIIKLGKSLGFYSGVDFPKGKKDLPHFEIRLLPLKEMQRLYATKQTDTNGFINLI